MTWGARLLGFNAVQSAFKDVKMRFEDDAVYVVGTNVEYAVYVEFGTSSMSAQPYLFPAARDVSRDLDKHVSNADTLDEMIKLVALEIEREAKKRVPVDTGNLKNSIRAERVR